MSCYTGSSPALPSEIANICTFWYAALTSTTSGYTPPTQFYYLYQVASGLNTTICTDPTDPVLMQICSLNSSNSTNGSPAVQLQAMAAIQWMSNNSNSNPQQTYLQPAFQALYASKGVVTSQSSAVILNFYNYVMSNNFYSGLSDSSVETIWANYLVPFVTLMTTGSATPPSLNSVQFTTTNAEEMTVSSGTFPADILSIPKGTKTYTPIANANSKFTLTATDYLYTIDLGIGSVQAGVSSTQKFFTIQSSFIANPNTITISLPQVSVINNTQDTITGTIGGASINVAAGATLAATQMKSVPLKTDSLSGGSDFTYTIDLASGTATAGSGSNQTAYTASISQSGTLFTVTVSTATVQFTNATLYPMVFKFPTGTDTSSFFTNILPTGDMICTGNTCSVSAATAVATPLALTATIDQFTTSWGSAFTLNGQWGVPAVATGDITVTFKAGQAPTLTVVTPSKDFSVTSSFDSSQLVYSIGLTDTSTPVGPVGPTAETMIITNNTGEAVTLSGTLAPFDNKVMIAPSTVTFNPDGTYTIPSTCNGGCSFSIPDKLKFTNFIAQSLAGSTVYNQFLFTDSNKNWIYVWVTGEAIPVLSNYSCDGYGTSAPTATMSWTPPQGTGMGTYGITIPESTTKEASAIVFNNNTPYEIVTDISYAVDDPMVKCMDPPSVKYQSYAPGLIQSKDINSNEIYIISPNALNVTAQYTSSISTTVNIMPADNPTANWVNVHETTEWIANQPKFTLTVSGCACSGTDSVFAISCKIDSVTNYCTVSFGYKTTDVTAIYLSNALASTTLNYNPSTMDVFNAYSGGVTWEVSDSLYSFSPGEFSTLTVDTTNLTGSFSLSDSTSSKSQVTISLSPLSIDGTSGATPNSIVSSTFGGIGGNSYTLVMPVINSLSAPPVPKTTTINFTNNTNYAITWPFSACTIAAGPTSSKTSCSVDLTTVTQPLTFTGANGIISFSLLFTGATTSFTSSYVTGTSKFNPTDGSYSVTLTPATILLVYPTQSGAATTIYMNSDQTALTGYSPTWVSGSGYSITSTCTGSSSCKGSIGDLLSASMPIQFTDGTNSLFSLTASSAGIGGLVKEGSGSYSATVGGISLGATVITISYEAPALTTIQFNNTTDYAIQFSGVQADFSADTTCITFSNNAWTIPVSKQSCAATLGSNTTIQVNNAITFYGVYGSNSDLFSVNVAIAGTSIVNALNISATPSGTSPSYALKFDIGTFQFSASNTPPLLYMGSTTPIVYKTLTSIGSYLEDTQNITDDSANKNTVFTIDFVNQKITNIATAYSGTTISNNIITVAYAAPVTYTINFTNTTSYEFTSKSPVCSTSSSCVMSELGVVNFTETTNTISFAIDFTNITNQIRNTFVQINVTNGIVANTFTVTIAPRVIQITSSASDALDFTLNGVSSSVSSAQSFSGTVGTSTDAVQSKLDFTTVSSSTTSVLELDFSNAAVTSTSTQGYQGVVTHTPTEITVAISSTNASSTIIIFSNTSSYRFNIPGATSAKDFAFNSGSACLTPPVSSSPYQIPSGLPECAATLAGGFAFSGNVVFSDVTSQANFTIDFSNEEATVTINNNILAFASCSSSGSNTICTIGISPYVPSSNTINVTLTGGLTQIAQDSATPPNFIYLDPTMKPPSLVVNVMSPTVSATTSNNTTGWILNTPLNKKNDAFALQWISEGASIVNLTIADSGIDWLTLVSSAGQAIAYDFPSILSLDSKQSNFVNSISGNLTIEIDQSTSGETVELNTVNYYPDRLYTSPAYSEGIALPSATFSGSGVTGNQLAMSISRATGEMKLDLTLVPSEAITLYPYYVFNNSAMTTPLNRPNPNNGIVMGKSFTFTFILAQNNKAFPTGIAGIAQGGTITVSNGTNSTIISFSFSGTLTAGANNSYALTGLTGTIEGATVSTGTVTLTISTSMPSITLSGTLTSSISTPLTYSNALTAAINFGFTTSS